MKICKIDDCTNKHLALGYCKKHYGRFKKSGDPMKARKNTIGMPLIDRFNSFVVKTDSCWLWNGGKAGKNGYGTMRVKNKGTYAHRISYELFIGEIPEGLHVLHRCDNPPCVNPEHLFVGTHADNIRDMHEKGRAIRPKGEDHYKAKLNISKVTDIINSLDMGIPVWLIARKHSVTTGAIYAIKKGATWSHFTGIKSIKE